MNPFTTLSTILQVIAFWANLHPIHVSVTEIEFDSKQATLEIMMRVFIDDLELSLRNSLNKPELDILNPPKGVKADDLIRDYLADHFSISLDGRMQKTTYLGHEREGEAFIFYVEATDVKTWRTITIRNDIIMATHDDQSNIVHVYIGEKVKSLRLTRNTPSDKLTFEP